jgi:hypothetical protein
VRARRRPSVARCDQLTNSLLACRLAIAAVVNRPRTHAQALRELEKQKEAQMAEIAQRFIEERSKELPVYLRLQQQYQERVLQPELERQHTRIEELKAERSPLDMSKVRALAAVLLRVSSLGRCRQLREHETEYLQKHQAM